MNTTIYVPMPEWQALSFLRDLNEAFARIMTPCGVHLDGEVTLINDETLVGYRNRDGAIQTGYCTHPQGFAILRIIIGKLHHGSMMFQGQLVSGKDHPDTGASTWLVNRSGMEFIREKALRGEVEILMDQIFGPCVPEERDCGCAVPSGPDHDNVHRRFEPIGPTGFGC